MPAKRKPSKGSYKVAKPAVYILAGLVVVGLLASLTSGIADGGSLLFVQSSARGSLTLIDDELGEYSLTLMEPNPKVSFYANRPALDTGTMDIEDLFGFLFVPGQPSPNGAAILGDTTTRSTINFQFRSGSVNPDGSVSYVVRRLDQAYGSRSETVTQELEQLPPDLSSIELFLDSGALNRCQVRFTNWSSASLTLESLDPSTDSWNWAQHPFVTVDNSTIFVYRAHSSTDQTATLVYAIDGSKTTVTINVTCPANGSGHGSCTIEGDTSYTCGVNKGFGTDPNLMVNLHGQ